MTDSFLTQLTEGFAQLLANEDTGFSWQADGVYADGETGIYVEVVPPDPDRVVVLTVTLLTADPTLANSAFNLQARTRASRDPREVYTMDDSIQDQLLGRYPITLANGVRVTTLKYVGGGSLGVDDNQRSQRSSNLQGVAYRPGPHRL